MKTDSQKNDCTEMFRPFIEKDFSKWKPWNSECVVCCLDDFFVRQNGFLQGFAGSDYSPAQFSHYQIKNYSENIRIWYRTGKFLKLEVGYPDINFSFPEQLSWQDASNIKLDYDFGNTIIRNGELVYPNQGISFFLNGDYNRVIKVLIFLPATINTYNSEIRTSAQAREF